MTRHWEYPVYVIPLGGGFVSIVDPNNMDPPVHALAVFSQETTARQFMGTCEITGTPRPLDNAYQFGWLLQSLQAPVTQVAFDPDPHQQQVTAAWLVAVEELLKHDLVVDRSPWKYPVFVISQPTGFASIEGQASDGEDLTAVCLFTTQDKAMAYLDDALQVGEIQQLDDRHTVREFLRMISTGATAIALNPVVREGRHTAEYCVSIRTLIDKYLVEDDDGLETE